LNSVLGSIFNYFWIDAEYMTLDPKSILNLRKLFRWMLLGSIPFCFANTAISQALRVQPKPMRVRPDLVCVLCSLSVSATPGLVSFTLVKGGTALASAPIVITTTMSGVSVLGSVSLYGYFSTASAALTDGLTTPNNIPSSAVLGQDTTGSPTSYTAFTQSTAVGTAGASLQIYSVFSILSLGCTPITASCRTDSLNLEINLSALPQLPAGSYTGTLILQAQAL
jgi:hypothetical protein